MRLISTISLLCLLGCKIDTECEHLTSPIKIVGGCNKNGECGAILEDGTVLRNAHQPVPGALPEGFLCHVVNKK